MILLMLTLVLMCNNADLATGDDLVVSSGATANATNIAAFVADSGTTNAGTATLTAISSGGTIDLTLLEVVQVLPL